MNKRCFMGCLLAIFLVLVGASAYMFSDSRDGENIERNEDIAGSEDTEKGEDIAGSENVILGTESNETVSGEESNSQKWNNPDCEKAISRYARKYHLEFEVADKEIEDRIYGVWQVQKIVGWDKEDKDHSNNYLGKIYIFSQEAWIDKWPKYRPVYFYHTARLEDLSSEDILNVSWKEREYEKQEAVFVIGIDVEGYEETALEKEYSHVVKLLLLGDKLILQSHDNTYLEMEKVAEAEIQEGVLDVR